MNNEKRYEIIDFLRGLAVILMIFFHFSFDLNYFYLVSIDFFQNKFWWFLPRFIVFLFFLCSGLSLKLAHYHRIQWKRAFQRILLLTFWASIISLVTFLLFPENWIYFGTLHSLALCSLCALPFLLIPLEFTFLLVLISLSFFLIDYLIPSQFPYWIGHQSLDYISMTPWFGAILAGIYISTTSLLKNFSPLFLRSKISIQIQKLGKHSLVIYLLHQPILFSLCYLLSILIK